MPMKYDHRSPAVAPKSMLADSSGKCSFLCFVCVISVVVDRTSSDHTLHAIFTSTNHGLIGGESTSTMLKVSTYGSYLTHFCPLPHLTYSPRATFDLTRQRNCFFLYV